jgi:hypothetical protein
MRLNLIYSILKYNYRNTYGSMLPVIGEAIPSELMKLYLTEALFKSRLRSRGGVEYYKISHLKGRQNISYGVRCRTDSSNFMSHRIYN